MKLKFFRCVTKKKRKVETTKGKKEFPARTAVVVCISIGYRTQGRLLCKHFLLNSVIFSGNGKMCNE